ncbi:beta-lactamase family protein [SAR92 clade bacterium H231]|nr:beta-lactamase family protein [SAR92 clade bacterium H231]
MVEVRLAPDILKNFQGYIEQVQKQYNVPALSVAILFNNKRYSATSGVLNLDTGVEATSDSIFQIASISKVFTASLIMQLVDEGKLLLDAPVKQYLRDFNLADSATAEKITVAQLLNHTNGIPGDFIGNNSYTEQNPLARYVDRCSALYLIHPPGERYSYSNAAYNIAGRLIEVILGTTWFDAIEERIFKPLGMKQAVAHPSQVIKHRVALGHVPNTDNEKPWSVSPDCYFPICWAPCGSVLTLSASDLITFAEAHLNEGRTQAGLSWLSPTSVKLMQQAQTPMPSYSYMSNTHCALGWHLTKEKNTVVVGHFGTGPGQKSMLQLVPENKLAIAALHNSTNADLLPALLAKLLSDLVNIQLPEITAKPGLAKSMSLEPLVGRYESSLSAFVVSLNKGELSITYMLFKQAPEETERWSLSPIDNDTFLAYNEIGEPGLTLSFLDFDPLGKPTYLYCMGRLIPKVKGEYQ